MVTSLLTLLLLVFALAGIAIVVGARFNRRSSFRFADLWRWRGEVGRGVYAAVGVIGFALKHNLDRAVATLVFQRRFGIFNYWIPPVDAIRVSSLSRDEAVFLATMVAISLPFIWIGLAMTLRRLRSAGMPLWLVFLFFVPVLNIAFFLILSFVPETERYQAQRKAVSATSPLIPESVVGSASLAVVVMGAVGAALAYFGVQTLGTYAWGVFVALPFCLGLGAVMIYSYHQPRSLASCLVVSLTAVGLVALALFALAVEGLICIAMAFPIAVPLALLGGTVGFLIQRGRSLSTEMPSLILMAVVMPAGFMGIETVLQPVPVSYTVTTTIRIEASASEVWKNLVSFPDLPRSDSWLFRAGVSHPINATIDGEGVGATRECLFSTGTFIERIEGWEVNKRLAFSVVQKADAMRELSPYNIHPRHLDGYFDPEKAEFTLISNPDGGTTLQGKSWYRNSMWPGLYWRLWSDKILHDVHNSVFKHVKALSENAYVTR